jgi:hypothetical protein
MNSTFVIGFLGISVTVTWYLCCLVTRCVTKTTFTADIQTIWTICLWRALCQSPNTWTLYKWSKNTKMSTMKTFSHVKNQTSHLCHNVTQSEYRSAISVKFHWNGRAMFRLSIVWHIPVTSPHGPVTGEITQTLSTTLTHNTSYLFHSVPRYILDYSPCHLLQGR